MTICGDAHLANFGLYASPERRLVFDLNDFDEACEGPFEFDLKRLAASIVVAGRERGLDAVATSRLVVDAIGTYRDWMDRYGDMSRLDVHYARIDADDLVGMMETDTARRRGDDFLRRVMSKNHLKALNKLTTMVDGQWRIVPDPPIVTRFDLPRLKEILDTALVQYHDSLAADRQHLFEQYRFVDFARKVVGVGSVGTHCWIVLLQGPNGGPLFLQVKEARPAVPHLALGRPPAAHEGRRVVESQRSLQAVSDILLGWTTGEEGVQYFVRQMWDAKGSFDIPTMKASGFRAYVRLCAWALARAHARTGDPATISGYVGAADTLPDALAEFAQGYADQTERDHAALVAALADGRLPSMPAVPVERDLPVPATT